MPEAGAVMILVWLIGAFLINLLIGAGVWAAIDPDDRRLFRWYAAAPYEWLKVAVLSAWPVGLYLWWRETRR
jgi:hypothetical protein